LEVGADGDEGGAPVSKKCWISAAGQSNAGSVGPPASMTKWPPKSNEVAVQPAMPIGREISAQVLARSTRRW
jgi:hypothetical protein